MDLGDILSPEQINADLKATNRWEAIDELIANLAASSKIKPEHQDAITAVVKKRESCHYCLRRPVWLWFGQQSGKERQHNLWSERAFKQGVQFGAQPEFSRQIQDVSPCVREAKRLRSSRGM